MPCEDQLHNSSSKLLGVLHKILVILHPSNSCSVGFRWVKPRAIHLLSSNSYSMGIYAKWLSLFWWSDVWAPLSNLCFRRGLSYDFRNRFAREVGFVFEGIHGLLYPIAVNVINIWLRKHLVFAVFSLESMDKLTYFLLLKKIKSVTVRKWTWYPLFSKGRDSWVIWLDRKE